MLRRKAGSYVNTPETGMFLDRAKPSHIGGLLELDESNLYWSWGKLIEALRTGKPQMGMKRQEELFDAIYKDQVSSEERFHLMNSYIISATCY